MARPMPPRPRSSSLFIAAAVGALALFAAAYANSLHNGFHFDDDHVIERNLHLRSLGNLPRFFADARTFSVFPQNATYRPIVSATLAIDYAIGGGLNPVAFHLDQLIEFLALGVLFFLVARRVLASRGAPDHWSALFAATLFCVHVANTQPGNYLSARSELLSAMGLLGAFVFYLEAPKLRRYGLYLIPMALGALAKPPAVVFAPLLLLYQWLFEEDARWRRLPWVILSTLPAFLAGALLFRFVEGMNPPGQSYGGGDPLAYLWTQAFVWLRYLGLFFVPHGLSADSDLSLLPTWKDPRVFAGLAVFAGSIAAALWMSRRPALRPAAFGIGWLWIGILPTSVVPLAEVTNDHRPFLGYLGLTLAVVCLAQVAVQRLIDAKPSATQWITRGVAFAACTVLIAHAVGTHLRNRVWRNEETLWADVVQKSPNNGRGWMNYGLTQMRKGELVQAKALFDRAATLVPNYPVLEVNQGVVLAALKDPAAEAHFRRAITLDPSYAPAHTFFARYLEEHGRGPEAVRELQRALAIDRGDPTPRHALMNLYAALGQQEALTALAKETLALGDDAQAAAHLRGRPPFSAQTDDAAGWYAAGLAYTNHGQHALAAQAYRRTVALDPRHADGWNNLGWSLYALGFMDDAARAYAQALSVNPAHERARNNLALISSQAGATP